MNKHDLIRRLEEDFGFAVSFDEEGRVEGFGSCDRVNVDEALKLLSLMSPEAVRDVDFGGSDLSDEGIQHLAHLPQLRSLKVSCTDITGRGLEILQTLPQLEELGCSPQEALADAMAYIGRAGTLRRISLQKACLIDVDLAPLSSLKNLEELDLSKTEVGSGVSVVEQMPKLRYLNLGFTKVNDSALEPVGHCSELQELWMGGQQISDVGLYHLRNLQELGSISFDGRVSAAGVRTLAGLKQLRTLMILDVPIDADTALAISEMKQLDKLWLRKGNISPVNLKLLKRSLRGCDVNAWGE